jgi:hypothetical protein
VDENRTVGDDLARVKAQESGAKLVRPRHAAVGGPHEGRAQIGCQHPQMRILCDSGKNRSLPHPTHPMQPQSIPARLMIYEYRLELCR